MFLWLFLLLFGPVILILDVWLFFLICCCNQFCLPVCTTEDAVHTKRLDASQLVLLFPAHLRFCFCSSINVQILLSLSPHYSEFLVHVWCALLTSCKRQREYNHFPWVVRALVSAGRVDMCIIFWKRNMQSLKKAKLLKSKHVRGTDSVGAKVQPSLRGARFRKGVVGIPPL